jgi:hypothetical protein
MIFCFEGRKRVYFMTVLSIGISSKLNIISYKTLKIYIKKRFIKKKKILLHLTTIVFKNHYLLKFMNIK